MFKSLMQLFNKPTLLDIKRKQLLETQTALLNAQTGLDFAKATVDYHNAVIARLTASIEADTTDSPVNVTPIHPMHKSFLK
jgi:hypothetical protein